MLTPVTYEEVMKLINTSKGFAPGYDEVKIKPLQAVNSIIATALAHIFNLSVMNGIFPDILKIANVVPLFKKEDSMLFANIVLCLYCVPYQRCWKKSCTTGLSISLMNMKYSSSNSSASEKLFKLFSNNCINW